MNYQRLPIKGDTGFPAGRSKSQPCQDLVQNALVILLDEPMNSLDLKYQSEITGYLQEWIHEEKDRVLIGVYHDINLARMLSDELIFIKKGGSFIAARDSSIDYPAVLEKRALIWMYIHI